MFEIEITANFRKRYKKLVSKNSDVKNKVAKAIEILRKEEARLTHVLQHGYDNTPRTAGLDQIAAATTQSQQSQKCTLITQRKLQ